MCTSGSSCRSNIHRLANCRLVNQDINRCIHYITKLWLHNLHILQPTLHILLIISCLSRTFTWTWHTVKTIMTLHSICSPQILAMSTFICKNAHWLESGMWHCAPWMYPKVIDTTRHHAVSSTWLIILCGIISWGVVSYYKVVVDDLFDVQVCLRKSEFHSYCAYVGMLVVLLLPHSGGQYNKWCNTLGSWLPYRQYALVHQTISNPL